MPAVDERPQLLPNFCDVRVVFTTVIVGELLALVLTLVSIPSFAEFGLRLSQVSMFVQWIGLVSAGVFCLTYRYVPTAHRGRVVVASFMMATVAVVTLATSVAAWLLTGRTTPLEPFALRNLAVALVVAGFAVRYLFLLYGWRERVYAAGQARFEALQARIRPHFLFNSMNTLAHLARTDPQAAERAVEDLADLFRVALGRGQRATLGSELELGRRYLGLESHRLGERLRVDWQIDQLPGDAVLPQLYLQPLLENAVYHGIERARAGGTVRVSGGHKDGTVTLRITNTLADADTRPRPGNRMAQDNVRARLEAFFAGDSRMTVSSSDGQYQVLLQFPYRRQTP